MSSPISFGDAFLMAKLAWTLAHAFTQGRHSAPAEFREVENQLYSLSSALEAFKKACDDRNTTLPTNASLGQVEAATGNLTIRKIMENCNETLKHLESVVDKYSIISPDSQEARRRQWSKRLLSDLKKIAWTTEKGDLATLRSQLMVHTNSLDLVMGVIINAQTARIGDILSKHSTMLEEIHSWMTQGLLSTNAPSTEANQLTRDLDGSTQPRMSPITFEIYVESSNGQKLVCKRASLDDSWNMTNYSATNQSLSLFACQCELGAALGGTSHKDEVAAYTLSHLTFPFRVISKERSWTLYKTADLSTNQLVSVIIQNVPLGKIFEFVDKFVAVMSEFRANLMLRGGMSNMLAYISPETQKEHILNLRSDLKDTHKSLQSVSFAIGRRTYSRDIITGVSLLHYRMLELDTEASFDMIRAPEAMCEYAEITVYYGEEEGRVPGDITRSVMQVRRNTPLKVSDDKTTLLISGVRCSGYIDEEQTSNIEKTDVTFNFASVKAAQYFEDELEKMKMELFIWSLQYPQADERVALHLQTAQVQCEEVFITEAEIFIVRNSEARYRLIIVSHNKCTILSQVLSDDFFSSPASANFRSPTWLVQILGGGENQVSKFPDGFRHLSFQGKQAERMFEIGRNTLSRTLTMGTFNEGDSMDTTA